ncbi:MAG: hypothetical protein ACYC4S_05530 [Rhodoferax sp.]
MGPLGLGGDEQADLSVHGAVWTNRFTPAPRSITRSGARHRHWLAGEGFDLVPGPRYLRITESFKAKMAKHLR